MANLISSTASYARRLFASDKEQSVIFVGLDAGGKTSLLYRLKLGEQVITIPTIGFNVETITTEGTALTLWDVGGGCGRMLPLLARHYFHPEVAILFIIDASDTIRVSESLVELEYVLRTAEAKHLAVVFNKRDHPACKEMDFGDLVARVRDVIEQHQTDYPCGIYDDLEELSAATGAQTDLLLKRLVKIAKSKRSTAVAKEEQKSQPLSKMQLEKPPPRDELLKKIEESAKNPDYELPADEFMRRVVTGDLDVWDHLCHLRAGFICLNECITKDQVVFDAAELFLGRLAKMMDAKPDKFRKTIHRTLTTFWIRFILLEMISFRADHGTLPPVDGFHQFILEHPDLMDGRAWVPYYTKDLLFGEKARSAWVLPDLQYLPPLEMKAAEKKKDPSNMPTRTNAEVLRRFAYAILREAKKTNRRRAAVINETFPAIQSHIMRLRVQSPQAAAPYSETQAYFWVQMLHAAVESLPGSGLDITKLSFESFKILFPDLLAADDAWKEFYSAEQWNGLPARMNMVLPDLKPLPNVLEQPDRNRIEDAAMSTLEEKYAQSDDDTLYSSPNNGRPTTEELFLKARWAVKETSDSPNPTYKTHAGMLKRIFNELVETDPNTLGRGDSYASVAWFAVSFPRDKEDFTKVVFWSRLVLSAYCGMDPSFHQAVAENRSCSRGGAKRTELFARFLDSCPELCWEELWTLYFTDETWRSVDASEMYILPDRRAIPAYVEKKVSDI